MVTAIIWQFSYLQMLDFLTTVAFLALGVQEGNPLVRWAIAVAPSPVYGLAAVKIAALCLGIYCMRMGKLRLLTRINYMFALVVAWNMVALIIKATNLGPGIL
ncbi:MAG: hypothetical protein JJE04_13195 [Acidobacteriia bacterium]|nr:hypothetical protein [Terriglobia bacterium]